MEEEKENGYFGCESCYEYLARPNTYFIKSPSTQQQI